MYAGAVCGAMICASPEVFGQDAGAPTTKVLENEDAAVRIAVSAAWGATPARGGNFLACWQLGLPDAGKGFLAVEMVPGTRNELLGTAWLAHESKSPAKFVSEPVPHVVAEIVGTDGSPWRSCSAVRVVRRRGFVVGFQCSAAAFEKYRAEFLAALATFTSSRGEYPDMPDTYTVVLRDAYKYYLHPDVPATEVAAVHRVLLAQETAFEKRHGQVPKSDENPIVVVLHARPGDAVAVSERAGDGFLGDPAGGRLLAVVPIKDVKAQATMAMCFALVLHSQAYSLLVGTSWVSAGEGWLAHFEATAGKPFPAVAASLAAEIPASLRPLAGLVAQKDLSMQDALQAMVYLAFLRTGAKPYADGFARYVKDVRAGANPADAAAKHLLSLDQGALRAAAEVFAQSFKPVKGR